MSNKQFEDPGNLHNCVHGLLKAMALRCALELGIPDIIHSHGLAGSPAISLSQLARAIPIQPTKTPHLRRLMRLLVHLGIFAAAAGTEDGFSSETGYLLTPSSRLLLTGDDEDKGSLATLSRCVLNPIMSIPSFYLGDWFNMESVTATPFELCHGEGTFWEVAAKKPEFGKCFYAAMAGDSKYLMGSIVTQCPHVFQGLRTVVDVGGGTGASARAIAKAFPHIRVKVLDLPHVVADLAPEEDGVEFIGGDMFQDIPPADAVFLKWILHDWNDQECVQILRKCKEVVSSKEEGGKVIIVEMVVNSKIEDHQQTELEYVQDVWLMILTAGRERDEHEWSKIFEDAGFKDYKITPVELDGRCVIELYH